MASANTSNAELTCPECGRTFARAAALGAHRFHSHGVKGVSAKRTTRRRGRRSAQPAARQPATSRASKRDVLLRTLFPQGVPANEQTLRAVTAWLDEAERLAAR